MLPLLEDAAALFLVVASICTVLLTAGALFVGTMLWRAGREVFELTRRTRAEAERVIDWQKRIHHRARFAGKWIRIMGEHASQKET